MVTRNPLVNQATIDALRSTTYPSGMETLRNFNGNPTLTFTRQGGGGAGLTNVISVKLRNAQPTAMGEGTPVEMIVRKGDVKLFSDHIPSGKTIRQGDRFAWNGLTCVVEAEEIERIPGTNVLGIPFVVEDVT